MAYQIVKSSPQALAKKVTFCFHLDQLEIGQSVFIPVNDFAEQTIRNAASKAGKKLARKFSVIKHHGQEDAFEIARLA